MLFFAVVLCWSTASPSPIAAADPDERFVSANRDFESGNFAEAASKYHELAREGHISSDLYFNLGTAAYRLGKVGEAILWMRRALVVEPAMPEVRQSLEFLRSKVAFLEFTEGRVARVIGALPATFGKWASSIGIWTSLIALSLAFFVQKFRSKRSVLITIAIIGGMGTFVALRIGHYRATRVAIENFATITTTDVRALTAPAPDAKSVIDLPPGSEVRILRDSGQWRYAEIPGDLRGWIRTESLEPVWPVTFPETSP